MTDDPLIQDFLEGIRGMRADVQEMRKGIRTLLAERHAPDPLLSRKAICDYLGRSKAWFYAQGFWPEPDQTLPGRNGKRWKRSTIDRVIQERER